MTRLNWSRLQVVKSRAKRVKSTSGNAETAQGQAEDISRESTPELTSAGLAADWSVRRPEVLPQPDCNYRYTPDDGVIP
jgi:hypothetical protein